MGSFIMMSTEYEYYQWVDYLVAIESYKVIRNWGLDVIDVSINYVLWECKLDTY